MASLKVWIGAVVLALVVASPAAAASGAANYKLGSGDKVRVIVYGEDDMGGTFEVDGNGTISLPLIGPVKAAGLSAPQLEAAITGDFAAGYLNDPRVSIEITTYRPFYVMGQVNRPGQYAYVNDMSVLNAVAMAGGYTDHAVESSICIRRNGEAEENCVDTDETIKVYPGDVLRVRESSFWSAVSVIGPLSGLAYLKF
ncbi:MAG TPA: polysaccharide biosynthesis/export family protein [Rhizomicrobium sp.]|jgi:polysaccharide export outer membrane protein